MEIEVASLAVAASNVLLSIIDKLKPILSGTLALNLKEELKDLDSKMREIHDKLLRVETPGTHANRWQQQIKEFTYDVEDLLDDIELEERWMINSKVHVHNSFLSSLPYLIGDIREDLGNLNKSLLRSIEAPIADEEWTRESYSVFEGGIGNFIGRRDEIKKIVEFLSSENNNDNNTCSIVGIGGVGKTALAQVICQLEEVKKKLVVKWAHVGFKFDLKKILPQIGGYGETNNSLETQIRIIKESLRTETRYLFVLDDLWDINLVDLFKVKSMLLNINKGNKFLITTRNQRIAEMAAKDKTVFLNPLKPHDCLPLIQKFVKSDLFPKCDEIKEECEGVPLAAITLGIKLSEGTIRGGDIWSTEDVKTDGNIMNSLKFSYDYLPPRLKDCFAYHVVCNDLHKESLTQMWTAQGFIKEPEDGDTAFDELKSASFFYDVTEDIFGGTQFKVRKLFRALILLVSEEYADTTVSRITGVPRSTRHVSLSSQRHAHEVQESRLLSKLRTVVGLPEIRLLSQFKGLRVLVLFDVEFESKDISFGNLTHLRFLDLSRNGNLEVLPESLGELLFLETLRVGMCEKLKALLPNENKLKILGHFLTRERSYFTKLETLEIVDCPRLRFQKDDMENLRNLNRLAIIKHPNLTNLPEGFRSLTSLERLTIEDCPRLELSSTVDGRNILPRSLKLLRINGCDELTKRCESEEGRDDVSLIKEVYLNGILMINLVSSSSSSSGEGMESAVSEEEIKNFDRVRGRDKEKQDIVRFLTENRSKTAVVTMSGIGGIGKTTLARLVCKDEEVQIHFHPLLWANARHAFHLKTIIEDLLELDLDRRGIFSMDELQKRFKRRIEGQSCLLVLDDVGKLTPEQCKELRDLFDVGIAGVLIATVEDQDIDLVNKDETEVSRKPTFMTIKEKTGSRIKNLREEVGIEEGKKIIKAFVLDESENKLTLFIGVGIMDVEIDPVRSICNDKDVKDKFEFSKWVPVPGKEFNLKRIVRGILDEKEQGKPLEQLQIELQNKLQENKRFLIGLDVYAMNAYQCDKLEVLLMTGKIGNKLLITTRDKQVQYMKKHLGSLSRDDSLNLFVKNAEFDEMRREIIEGCRGVPLLVRMFGGILSDETDENKLKEIQEKIKNSGPFDVSEILKLSFDTLPPHIKKCFLYSTCFTLHPPERGRLTQQWIAHGLIECSENNRKLEALAREYFDELLSRSFYYNLVEDDLMAEARFEVHDLVYKLAHKVSEGECCVTSSDQIKNIPSTVSHLAFSNKSETFPSLRKLKKLRTFKWKNFGLSAATSDTKLDMDSLSRSLRVVDLSGSQFEELPSSIGELRDLRYLDVSYNIYLDELPNSLFDLSNLETLRFEECGILELPRDFSKLKKLRNLYACTEQGSIPEEVISGLASLRILHLNPVHNLETLPRNLENLTALETLVLRLCSRLTLFDTDIKGLKCLRNLTITHIKNKESLLIPSSLEDAAASLSSLCLSYCLGMATLPEWLVNLQCLRRLHVEFCPNLTPSPEEKIPFPNCLEYLSIRGCPELTKICESEDWQQKNKGIREIHLDGRIMRSIFDTRSSDSDATSPSSVDAEDGRDKGKITYVESSKLPSSSYGPVEENFEVESIMQSTSDFGSSISSASSSDLITHERERQGLELVGKDSPLTINIRDERVRLKYPSTSFDALHYEFLAYVLSLTSPPDACRLSAVSAKFKVAADLDMVWENFLPSDYKAIVFEADDKSSRHLLHLTKKKLYFRLCDTPIIVDGGKKSFFLDKRSGKKCYMIAAAELHISWGDKPQYWNWRPIPESRFSNVAVLRSVCWLALDGKINVIMLSFKTNYAAYFVFKLETDAYGFQNVPIEVSVGLGGDVHRRNVLLDPESVTTNNELLPTERIDGWLEIEMGEYFIEEGDDGDLEMSLREVVQLNWKAGMIVQGIEVRPKAG